MKTTDAKADRRAYFHVAMVFVITIGVALIPPFGQMTSYGMQVLGIFLGTLYGWIFCELFWPSVLALIMLGFTEFGGISQVFVAGFGNSNVVMLLMVFIFVGYLELSGLMRFIAEWFVSRKICAGRPYVFLMMMMIPAAIFGAFINVWAGLAIVWSLFFKACEILEFNKDDGFVCMGVLGTTIAASVTPTLFTFRPVPIMANGWVKTAVGFGYDPQMWFILQGLACVISILILLMVFKLIVKPDVSRFIEKGDLYADLREKRMTAQEKWALGFLVFFVMMLTIPLILPKSIKWVALINNFSIIGTAALCLLVGAFLKVEGEPLVKVQACVQKGVNWPLIFMLAASFPIGDALEQETTGIIATFTQFVAPVIGKMSPVLFMVMVIIVFNLISQVMHNLVLMMVFTPVLCQLALSIGLPVDVFAPIFVFAVNTALITPGSSATGAMLHGNTQWMSTKKTYLWAIMATVIIYLTLIVLIPIGLLLCQ